MKKTTKQLLLSALVCSLVAVWPASLLASSAVPSASQGGVSWQVTVPNDGISLRVIMPDGSAFEQRYASGQSPVFTSQRGVLADGAYTYELIISPVVSPELRAKAEASREGGPAVALPTGTTESGTFRVERGAVRLPDVSAVESGSAATGNRLPSPNDQVIADDLIVQGSACAGLDCVNNESFNFDTIRLKENNTRIGFRDTSVGSFPANNWQLRANSSSGGGANFFGIVDQGTDSSGSDGGNILFAADAGAPNDSIHISNTGRVGFRTATPVLDLHVATGDTPGLRLEQKASSGFTPQTWDIAGNEANFFVRDITGASRLPFRIRPGAPTSSIDIAASGNVGVGTASPQGHLHVSGTGTQLSLFQSSDNGAVQFRLKSDSTNRRFIALNSADQQQSQLVFGDNGAFDFLGPTAADVRMRFLANGNVGIGTTTPDQKLSVNGNASKPGGGSWATFSDERLKDIKGEFTSGLDAVMKLTPIRYAYKADNASGIQSEGEHIGFGAAAVRKIIPEAVTRNEAGYLMIDNDPILWTMLNAIKEQNAQIEKQSAEIKQLKAQNKGLVQLKAQNRQIVEKLERLQAQVVLQAENQRLLRKRALAEATR